jgi:ABC-type antimicrobial peptide transport system permease subunit
VSEGTARRFWPGQNALGKHVTLTMLTKEPAEVVGVAAEAKLESLTAAEADSETAIYAPARQFANGGAAIAARTSVPPESLTRALTDAIHAVDPDQPVLNIVTLDTMVEQSLGQRPFTVWLLTGFAALAMVLASVGIYSVVSYTVRQRVREIGIRVALGAQTGRVLWLVLVEGLRPALIGVIVGLTLAVLLAGVMRTLLFGVGQHDPATFAVVVLLMLGVGLAATLIPAYRATRVDVITTLRAD